MSLFFQYFCTFIAGFVVGFVKGWELTLVILSVSPLLAIAGGVMGRVGRLLVILLPFFEFLMVVVAALVVFF